MCEAERAQSLRSVSGVATRRRQSKWFEKSFVSPGLETKYPEALLYFSVPENYDADVLQPFMETLALEITRALQFFFTSTTYNQVDQIVLAGGCAALPGLDELVAKRASVSTVVGNPFASMQVSDRIRPRQLAQDAPLLTIATGLALRSFE